MLRHALVWGWWVLMCTWGWLWLLGMWGWLPCHPFCKLPHLPVHTLACDALRCCGCARCLPGCCVRSMHSGCTSTLQVPSVSCCPAMHTFTLIHMHVGRRARPYTCAYVHMRACTYTGKACTCIQICVHARTCNLAHTCACTRKCSFTRTSHRQEQLAEEQARAAQLEQALCDAAASHARQIDQVGAAAAPPCSHACETCADLSLGSTGVGGRKRGVSGACWALWQHRASVHQLHTKLASGVWAVLHCAARDPPSAAGRAMTAPHPSMRGAAWARDQRSRVHVWFGVSPTQQGARVLQGPGGLRANRHTSKQTDKQAGRQADTNK